MTQRVKRRERKRRQQIRLDAEINGGMPSRYTSTGRRMHHQDPGTDVLCVEGAWTLVIK